MAQRPYLLLPLLVLGLLVPAPAMAGKKPVGEWFLVKCRHGYEVYNYYATAESKIPVVRITGMLKIPFRTAVELLWDPEYESVEYLEDYVVSIEPVKRGAREREDYYVFRVPVIARLAVRVGSGLRGSLGRRQYGNLRLNLDEGDGEAVVRWTAAPMPAHITPPAHGYEISKNDGHWRLQPVSAARTRFIYQLDVRPGGKKVPPRLIRWANNTGTRLPRLLEKRYRDTVLSEGHRQP